MKRFISFVPVRCEKSAKEREKERKYKQIQFIWAKVKEKRKIAKLLLFIQ